MSYDYSSSGATLELPNPYKVQNLLLFVAGTALLLSGLVVLLMAKDRLAAVPVALGLALVSLGLISFGVAAKRLRFFFGRGRPQSLAPELASTTEGNSQAADEIKRLLREGALTYPEPQGAIDGVLYHWVPQLITAPLAVQTQAQSAFFNLCAMVAAMLSFVVSWGILGTEQSRPMLSIMYFLFGALFLLRPILSSGTVRLSVKSLVLLIAAAVLGPAVVGMIGNGPLMIQLSLAPQAFMLLLSGTIAAVLMLISTLKQVSAPPGTQTSVEQSRLSLNVPPSLLLDELERHMQEQWTERIPNRRYARKVPKIHPKRHAGPFSGELLEESQPTPMSNMAPASIAQALGSDRHRFLALLDVYATVLVLIAVLCAMGFALQGLQGGAWPLHLLGASSIFLVVAGFCFRSSALLWGRFDFESTLTWVELEGTYQTATIGTGNQFTARVQTNNQVVRTESMTLRVWRARIESVVFGKDAFRQVTAMFSTDTLAKELAHHLAEFGRSQASLVAPESREDAARIAALAHAERALESATGTTAPLNLAIAAAHAHQNVLSASAESTSRFCRHCGAKNLADAKFCQACGERLDEMTAATT